MPGDISSGYVDSESMSDYLLNAEFSMREERLAHGCYRMVKAMRYGRWYLLKALSEEFANDPAYITRLHKEFEIAVNLDHPNIAKTISFEDVPGIGLSIVMEWIDGDTLDTWLPGTSRGQRKQALDQILSAVEYLHQYQVVHRDLKPSNIMVTRNGSNIKLIDFSLSDRDSDSRLKSPGGTEGYISPEQRNSRLPDQRNDIYSLGCIIADMRLGWSADRIARRCKRDIDCRYPDINHLRAALRRRHWPIRAALVAVAVSLGVGILIATRPKHGDIVEYIESRPEVWFDGTSFVRFGCDTMQFLRFENAPGEAMVGLGYADPYKCLHIPERIGCQGDTLTVTSVGYKACLDACFSYVRLPQTLQQINDFAFWGSGLIEVDIPDSVKYIGPGAFGKCAYLRDITFGRGVSVISRDVFMGSSLIRDIWMRTTIPPLLEPSSNFDYSATVHVPRGTIDLYRTAPTWELFPNIEEYDLN